MSAPCNPFDEWLPRVAADPIHKDEGPSGLNEEANENLWGFDFSREEWRGTTVDDVVRFLRAVEAARKRQILERFGMTHPMALYCWVDWLAGQLRLSLVSASHRRLPFGRPPVIVEDLAEIAREYLACAYHDGIPLREFRVPTQEELDVYVEPEPQAVRVRASSRPKSVG